MNNNCFKFLLTWKRRLKVGAQGVALVPHQVPLDLHLCSIGFFNNDWSNLELELSQT